MSGRSAPRAWSTARSPASRPWRPAPWSGSWSREGQAVNKGELIAEINRDKVRNGLEELDLGDREIANSEARAREKRQLLAANLGYWQKQVQRFERLQQSQSISGEQLEKSRLQLQEAQTSLFELDSSLEALQIQKERIANKRQALELTEGRPAAASRPYPEWCWRPSSARGRPCCPGPPWPTFSTSPACSSTCSSRRERSRRSKMGQRAVIVVDGMEGRAFSGHITAFGRKAEFSPKYIVAEKERQALLYQVKVRLDRDLDVFKIGMPVTVVFGR